MTIAFISDLHLHQDAKLATQKFLHFIKQLAPQYEALYILGDLFDVWIGDDDLNTYNRMIINSLHDLSQKNVKIYFLAGNRDFHISRAFAHMTHVTILQEPTVIDLFQRPTLLLHGDSLCLDDKSYQRFKSIVRHPFSLKLYQALPLRLRQMIANFLRGKSKGNDYRQRGIIADVTAEAIPHVMREHKVDLLIHGHTHQPTIHYFQDQNLWHTRIVLSDWFEHGNVLLCYNDGRLRLEYF